MKRIAGVTLATAAGLALAAPAEGAVECGDTIDRDRKLTADLVDCPAQGLTIDASNVTLDMNGHAIDGTNGIGIDIIGGARNVTVKDGLIRDAGGTGIDSDENNHLTLNNLDVKDAGNRGIEVSDAKAITIKKTVVRRSGNDAFFMIELQDPKLSDVAVKQADPGDGTGFDISDVEGLTFEHASATGEDGIVNVGVVLSGSVVDSRLTDIELENWGQAGFLIAATGGGNTILDDVATTGSTYGIEVSAGGAKIRNSVVNGNDDDGLLVNGTDSVRVTNSRFNGNDDDGIQFSSGATGAVGDNVAKNNGDDGILLPATGVTDLGGNRASGNGGTNCVNLSC